MPWYVGRINGTDIDIGKELVAGAASNAEGTWYADIDVWAGLDADPERFSDSASNDTTPVSFSESPYS